MTYTYDLNTNGCLILRADLSDVRRIQEIVSEHGLTLRAEAEALEPLLANSELDWIAPEEIGALTDAPILGLRDQNDKPTAAWAFMDYQVRSFLDDLINKHEAIFTS